MHRFFWWNWWIQQGASYEMLRKMIQSEFHSSFTNDIVKDKYKLTCGESLGIGRVVVVKWASEVSPLFNCDALCWWPHILLKGTELNFVREWPTHFVRGYRKSVPKNVLYEHSFDVQYWGYGCATSSNIGIVRIWVQKVYPEGTERAKQVYSKVRNVDINFFKARKIWGRTF